MCQWVATPVNDMFADCVLTAVLQAESLNPDSKFLPVPSKMDRMHFKVRVYKLLYSRWCVAVPTTHAVLVTLNTFACTV